MNLLIFCFRKTDQKQLNIILQFPANYPDGVIVTELTSKTLSEKLLSGLIKMCDEEAKKKLGQKQVGFHDKKLSVLKDPHHEKTCLLGLR